MDYNRIVQEILNIGEELLKSGAEIFRVEDSLYRMCRSYGFVRSDVYASQINIQMTVETPEGEIITQIRYIEMTSPHYDKLDQLNNLSRYVCANTPKQAEIHERYEKIAKSKVLAFPLMVLAQIVSGTSFAIFFGGGRNDAIVAVFASAAMALTGYWIGKQEKNPMIYNLVLAFVTEMVILLAEKMGMNEAQLYEQAMANTPKLLPVSIRPMDEIICEIILKEMGEAQDIVSREETMSVIDEVKGSSKGMDLYVMTNSEKFNGASELLFPENLDELSKKFDSDIYIIHSSTHEIIAISSTGKDVNELQEMVNEVNMNEVLIEDRLSNEVYHYDKNKKELTVASDAPNKSLDDNIVAEPLSYDRTGKTL